MYIISKRFDSSAIHQLSSLPPEHQYARLHGHNYIVEVKLQAEQLNQHLTIAPLTGSFRSLPNSNFFG